MYLYSNSLKYNIYQLILFCFILKLIISWYQKDNFSYNNKYLMTLNYYNIIINIFITAKSKPFKINYSNIIHTTKFISYFANL